MGLKTNIVLGVMAAGGLALGGWSAATLYMNKDAKQAENTLGEYELSTVAGHEKAEGEKAVALTPLMEGGTTLLLWHAEKNKPNGDHMAFNGTWSAHNGGLIYDPDTQELKALEIVIQANSISGHGAENAAPDLLIRTITGQTPAAAWFELDEHPTATFTATAFTPRDEATDQPDLEPDDAGSTPVNWTHLIAGTFTLNGVEQARDIPAYVEFTEGGDVSLNRGFAIDRQEFNRDGTAVGGWVVDDTVTIKATVESAPAGDIINQTLRAYGETITAQAAEIAQLQQMGNQIEELTSQIAKLQEQIDAGVAAGGNGGAPAVDLASLPGSFTDSVSYPNKTEPIPFDMVLVPGDAAAGIAPFYMSATEVTWELFYDWSYRTDLDANTAAELESQDLRPSTLYGDSDQIYIGLDKRPAISMSRRTAEAFCKWLSEQTGRNYRLPTDAEWHLALELGGGIPGSEDALLVQATMLENTEEHPDKWIPMTTEVGQRGRDALGIYDLLGTAAGWVTDTGADRGGRGGHFLMPAAELTADWGAVEDQKVWNETYPQAPVSRFWYRDHYYQGIRLVCDPVNLPE